MARSVLEIVFRTLKEGTADKDAQRSLKDLEKGFKETVASMGLFAGAGAAVVAALKFSVKEAMEAEKMQAKLAAVLKSTGNAAGLSQSQLNGMADSLSKMSGIDDELIVNSEAVMLTFTQIGDKVFPEAMEAALNMNAVLGGDLQQSVVQLGKALNVTAGDTQAASMGLTAMRRSGVSFTEEQKQMAMQMVKTGDVIGYQQLILKELNTEFGGAAKAMGDTAAGSAEKLKNSLGNLGAAYGMRLLPSIQATNEAMSEFVDWVTEGVEKANELAGATDTVAERFGTSSAILDRYGKNVENVQRQIEDVAAAEQYWQIYMEARSEQTANNTQVLLENEEAIKAQSDANKSLLSLIMQMQGEYTNYTEKNEELRLKMEELTLEQERYTEGSEKYNDIQAEIDETKTAIDSLAEEHEMAGKRIAFSLLQQKMSVDGLSDAEFSSLLSIGESWGILDKDVVTAAQSMNQQASNMAASLEEPRGMIMSVNDKVRALKNLTGSSFDFFVNIHTNGSFPDIPSRGNNSGPGAGYGNNAGVDAMAGGGQLGHGWAVVGEAGPELVTPHGYVIPNDISRELLRSGVSPEFAFRIGGDLAGTGVFQGGGGYKPEVPAPVNNGGGGGGGGVPPVVVQSELSQASQQVAASVVPLAEAATAAAQTSASVQQAAVVQTQALVTAVQISTEAMANQQRETNRLLSDQAKNMPRQLVAAFMQGNP